MAKSVTLNDLDWRNGRVVCVISPNSVALGANTYKNLSYRRETTLPSPSWFYQIAMTVTQLKTYAL